MTRIPLISDRIVIPTGDRSNIPSLVGWDTVEIGFIENCPRTLPAIPASFRRRINSIILRMYGGYNGKEINRTTSLVHFYPSVIHRDLLNEPDPDSIHFYSRVDRVDPPRFKLPRDNLLYWPLKVAQSSIVERGLERGTSRLSYNF